jgi:hypothetical protein
LDNLAYPGVYVIAVSESDLSDQPFMWLNSIIYVGVTNSISGLKGRLRQFDDTIAGRRYQHGGGDRVRYKFQNYDELTPQMFVAVAPHLCSPRSNTPEDLRVMGEVAKLEYDCLAQFVEIYGRLPDFNDKKTAPKHSLTIGRRGM